MVYTAKEHDMDVDSKTEKWGGGCWILLRQSSCYPSMSNFVRPLSLAVSFMFLWWQLTPVGFCKLLFHFTPLSSSTCLSGSLSLSCCHVVFPWEGTLCPDHLVVFFVFLGCSALLLAILSCGNNPVAIVLMALSFSIITQKHTTHQHPCPKTGKTSLLTGQSLTIIIPGKYKFFILNRTTSGWIMSISILYYLILIPHYYWLYKVTSYNALLKINQWFPTFIGFWPPTKKQCLVGAVSDELRGSTK